MHVFLETERLLLRRLKEADADLLFDLESDPEVMRWLNGGVPTPMDVIERVTLPEFIGCYERYGGLGYWAAIEREGGAFLGWFAMHPVEGRPHDEAEVGFRLRRTAWGRGLATEGLRALMAMGFTEYGLRRMYGTTYEENVGSRRVMVKAGMQLVRRFRWDADEPGPAATFVVTKEAWPGDDVEYAITRDEWRTFRDAGA